MKRIVGIVLACIVLSCAPVEPIEILIFTKTAGFRHESIEKGVEVLQKWGNQKGYAIHHTEDASVFEYNKLSSYLTVVFLNTTGNILTEAEQYQFQQYIRQGGGFVGVHAAADTEYGWPWYGGLVGAYFQNHPAIQEARMNVQNNTHPSTHFLNATWTRTDEWYNYRDINPDINVLINLDESSYEGGTLGTSHPIAWYHEYDGGQAFYTGMGHTSESYEDETYLKHLFAGIESTFAKHPLTAKNPMERMPDERRFTRTILAQNLDEPMELEVLPSGDILFIERKGALRLLNQADGQITTLANIPVYTGNEDGLLGLAIDPNFEDNSFIYLFYSPPGPKPVQHVSRFSLVNNRFDIESEQVVIEIPLQREECCHSGGCLEFGPDGLLYIGIGDNTNPFASDGFAPIDERPGRRPWDAQRSSGNTNDLRGKILRIRVQPDASYTIPEGNLFPEGTPNTRPEIYAMGLRNPFRLDIDTKTGWLYWGDVGPDSGKDGPNRGPKGYDGINQAQEAGNWGWPYIRGNHSRYVDYDFETESSGNRFDPNNLINSSPNNTGLKNIPNANRYFIWYSYDDSEDFPWVKTGGKNPMAGPVFHRSDFSRNTQTFPDYFENKLLVYEWMRDWIYVITLDDQGQYVRAEPFLPNSDFHNPIDMVFGPDGSLYILEYGEKWFAQNIEARINKITYQSGNQKPIARINASNSAGKCPITIRFSSAGSEDIDGDDLYYEWSFDANTVQSTEPNPSYNFRIPGSYQVKLKVTDSHGHSALATYPVSIGNSPPEVKIAKDENPYFWNGRTLDYEVIVQDAEDGPVSTTTPQMIQTTMQYLPEGQDFTLIAQGHQAQLQASQTALGSQLIQQSDCASCHNINEKINGPSYLDIAIKYSERDRPYLIQKIIQGGGGVWGENVMSAHPQLSEEDVDLMVQWILSLQDITTSTEETLPLSGTLVMDNHPKDKKAGSYILMASYKDRGGLGQPSITGRDQYVFTYPKFEAEESFYLEESLQKQNRDNTWHLGPFFKTDSFQFQNVYLTNVNSIECKVFVDQDFIPENAQIEVYSSMEQNKMIGAGEVTGIGVQIVQIPIRAKGYHKLNFILSQKESENQVESSGIWIDYVELIF